MESLDYIDSYFKGELDASETAKFEEKIISDPSFAADVAGYLSVLQVAKEQADEDKKKKFRELYRDRPVANTKSMFRTLWPTIAAAALVVGIIIGWYLFMKPVSPKQLADQYMHEQLQSLPVTMGAQDSMQKAIGLFNQEKLMEALQQFQGILEADPSNYKAIQYAGVASLRLQHYEKAFQYFKQLESQTGLHTNPGLFYQALTLMKRNDPGDKIKAKQLLNQISENDLEGKDVADKWLKNLQ